MSLAHLKCYACILVKMPSKLFGSKSKIKKLLESKDGISYPVDPKNDLSSAC